MEQTGDRKDAEGRLGRLTAAFARGLWLTIVVAVGLPVLIAPFSGTASQPALQTPVEVRPFVPTAEVVAPVSGSKETNTDRQKSRARRAQRRR